jgi:hypothetical protein
MEQGRAMILCRDLFHLPNASSARARTLVQRRQIRLDARSHQSGLFAYTYTYKISERGVTVNQALLTTCESNQIIGGM